MADTSGKLARLLMPIVAVIIFQAAISAGSLHVLSAVRAYVIGESLWSKGQKDAIRSLQLYAMTRSERELAEFDKAIAVPLGDLDARRALENRPADIEAARAGFLRGGNGADDVDALIWLFRHFSDTAYMRDAVRNWRATDATLIRLKDLRQRIGARLEFDGARARDIAPKEIDLLGDELTSRAIAFSQSLGESSKSIDRLLILINLSSTVLLLIFIVHRINRILKLQAIAESELRLEQDRAQRTLASIGEAVIVTDADDRISYMNPAASRLLKLSDAPNVSVSSLFQIVEKRSLGTLLYEKLDSFENSASSHQYLIRTDLSSVPVSVTETSIASGHSGGRVLVIHDMTQERRLLERLAWQASHDALTGLANRRYFEARLTSDFAADAGRTRQFSLMLIDLDQFKIVNDTCGHAAGDRLLKHVAAILQDLVGARGLVARLGGDEFGVLLDDNASEEAETSAERIRAELERFSFFAEGRSFKITASIGVVLSSDVQSSDETLSAADVACFIAKNRGRNRVQIHRPSDVEIEGHLAEMAWVQKIRDGLEQDRFCLYAQEIRCVSKARRRTKHFELLLRLRDCDGAVIAPGSFLPAAERYNLMPLIDRWVVRAAFTYLASLGQRAGRGATYAINISGASLGDREFADYILAQLAAFGVDPSAVCFEITETTAIANIAEARQFIDKLHALGCKFALDDFGTGMSSIAYLKYFPVDFLKIDGAFIREVRTSAVDRAMVEMIAKTAGLLGMEVIAEFVETTDLIALLADMGVDYVQGYAIGRPMPLDQSAARLPVAKSGGHG